MKKLLFALALLLAVGFSSCDLNDTDDNGKFSLYFKAEVNAAEWVASATRATLDNSGIQRQVFLEGDGTSNAGNFRINILPMAMPDTSITGSGLAGIISFTQQQNVWVSSTGILHVHEDHYVGGAGTKHQYKGTFSGTLINSTDGSTKTVTNGMFLVEGVF